MTTNDNQLYWKKDQRAPFWDQYVGSQNSQKIASLESTENKKQTTNKIEKIVINVNYRGDQGTKGLTNTLKEISLITGQKGVLTRAKKSIAGFQITKGDPLGIKVTLRKHKMYSFLQRLTQLSLPRVRDFQGISPLKFDGNGNFSFGIEDQLMFPEINPESVQTTQGLTITIVTSAKNDQEGLLMLKTLGMPFKV